MLRYISISCILLFILVNREGNYESQSSRVHYMEILGLKKGEVKLVPHNQKWVALFLSEKKLLEKNLGSLAQGIEHAGSTAIPGIRAKPIIDIWVGVCKVQNFKKAILGISESKYEQIRTTKSPHVHLVFAKGSKQKGTTHYLHLVKYKGKIWNDIVYFRDVLRKNRKLAVKYESLKLKLSKKYPLNRNMYILGKANFVKDVVKSK